MANALSDKELALLGHCGTTPELNFIDVQCACATARSTEADNV